MPQYFDVSFDTKPSVTQKRTMGRAGIVLHSTEGLNSLDWLQGESADAGTPASADFLIARNGNCYQITQVGYYSYHAGVAEWHSLDNRRGILNELLVGIELESHETNAPRYTDQQIITSAALCRRLMFQHWFGVTNIVYHGQIAKPPGRRRDPVLFPAFVWSRELLCPSIMDSAFVWPEVLP